MKVIRNKWVYKVKYNPIWTVSRYKARLVTKGYHHKEGIDYTETFSPVAKSSTMKVILSLVITYGWDNKQVDMNIAFLKGDLSETIYMSQPNGFENKKKPNHVFKLKKTPYSLKQAPQAWYEKLKGALLSWGFKNAISYAFLLYWKNKEKSIYQLIFVDNILITENNNVMIEAVIKKLKQNFTLKMSGDLNYFLGIEVK